MIKSEKIEILKPYHIIDGVLIKDTFVLNLLFEGLKPFFNNIENGIDRETFEKIVCDENLDKVPDGDGYGGYRMIVFSESEMLGRAWVVASFKCKIAIGEKEQNLFVVTGTGERGGEGERRYFKEEKYALAYLVAWLRSMKK